MARKTSYLAGLEAAVSPRRTSKAPARHDRQTLAQRASCKSTQHVNQSVRESKDVWNERIVDLTWKSAPNKTLACGEGSSIHSDELKPSSQGKASLLSAPDMFSSYTVFNRCFHTRQFDGIV